MANDKIKRGPKKGKRITSKILAEIVLDAIQSRKSLDDIVQSRRSSGFNIDRTVEENLQEVGLQEILFMLANIPIVKSIKEKAVADFINSIQAK